MASSKKRDNRRAFFSAAIYIVSARNIFLVGLMGSGKTTIGQMLARRLHWPFVDSDHELEARTGVSVATIFEIEGEPSFRSREAAAIDELTQRIGLVLATGGGAVLNDANREALRSRGTTIYLHSTPETSYERVRRNRDRPLLLVQDPLAKLKLLYEHRHPLYVSAAHFTVESYRDRPNSVVSEILRLTGESVDQDLS